MRDNEVLLFLELYLHCGFPEKNGVVTVNGLQRKILHVLFPRFPGLVRRTCPARDIPGPVLTT